MILKSVISFALFLGIFATVTARDTGVVNLTGNAISKNYTITLRDVSYNARWFWTTIRYGPMTTAYLYWTTVKYRPPRGYGHPPILTRPPTTTTVAPPKTTTTPDLPEQENEGPATTWNSQSFYASTGYSTGYFGGSGGDVEFDDDLTTTWGTTPTPTFKHQTTTPRATTTDATEEPPENENQQQSQTGSNYQGHSGYCFCTPFMYCPRGSIPRGGVCLELSWFSRHRFIRCCYRPSIAKYIHFNYEKRK